LAALGAHDAALGALLDLDRRPGGAIGELTDGALSPKAQAALATIGAGVTAAVVARARDDDPKIAATAVRVLGKIGSPAALAPVAAALDDPRRLVRDAAAHAIASAAAAPPPLLAALRQLAAPGATGWPRPPRWRRWAHASTSPRSPRQRRSLVVRAQRSRDRARRRGARPRSSRCSRCPATHPGVRAAAAPAVGSVDPRATARLRLAVDADPASSAAAHRP
jgi:HEAT repeat protein